MNKDIRYLYLHSVEHSGSTLIACILGAHPEISTVGEFSIDFPKKGLCACGKKYDHCKFWENWSRKTREHGLDFNIGNLGINLQPEHNKDKLEDLFYYNFPIKKIDMAVNFFFRSSRYNKVVQKRLSKYLALSRILCEIEGTDIFLDTSKNPYQIKFLAQQPDINLRVISLIRDGRAVMNSLVEREKYSPEQAVAAWKWGNRNIEIIKKNFLKDENFLQIRLEDLCDNPEKYKKALFEFCGVTDFSTIDYANFLHRHIVGNSMRHKFDGTIKKHDDSWKRKLSKSHLKLFYSKCGKLNESYGYR